MSRANIALFVPHIGCPHRCSFCDQRAITGRTAIPRAADVKKACEQALRELDEPKNSEIAFFGGSFTAIDRGYMTELLSAAAPFVGGGGFKGIRISTRPDCIDNDVLDLLKGYGVTAIELGAQSMSDKVLAANERGHTAADVENACVLIRDYGFELGLQMMIGLYKSDIADERYTVQKIVQLHPDTARIYPTVILKGTRLAELFESGEYLPFDMVTAIELTCEALKQFSQNRIKVIKVGLHASELVESTLVGGFYHPAFRELCLSRLFAECIEKNAPAGDLVSVSVSPRSVSLAAGHKSMNKEYFNSIGKRLRIIADNAIGQYDIKINKDVYNVFEIT